MYTLSTVLHTLWYLCTLFTVHTSRVLWYSSQHPPYSDVWLSNWLRQPSCFLVSSPLDIFNFTFALLLVIVDLRVHTFSVRPARYLQIPEKPESFRVLLLDLHLICPNTWLRASMSLRLLPCQFLLHLFLATFLCCCFWTFFNMLQCQIPAPACWLNFLVLFCLILIMFSCVTIGYSWLEGCS